MRDFVSSKKETVEGNVTISSEYLITLLVKYFEDLGHEPGFPKPTYELYPVMAGTNAEEERMVGVRVISKTQKQK